MDYDTWQTLKVSPSVRGLFELVEMLLCVKRFKADYDSEANIW